MNTRLTSIASVLEAEGQTVLYADVGKDELVPPWLLGLPAMWRVIGHAARDSDCQVFATTHSRECVAAAHQVFSESFDYDLSVQRLEATNGQVRAVAHDRLRVAQEQGNSLSAPADTVM